MKYQPMEGSLIVELIDTSETQTSSGIVLKQNTKESVLGKGLVVATCNTMIHAGQEVCFSKYKGVRFEEDGVTYVHLKEADILMKA